jgi:hypothetical protein
MSTLVRGRDAAPDTRRDVGFAGSGGATGRPLTALEEAIHLSDRPDAPKVVALLAYTDGRLAEPGLRRATAVALARHPLAQARLRTGGGTLRWEVPRRGADPVTVEACGGDERLLEAFARLCGTPLDLAGVGPVRVTLLRGADMDALALVAHHCAMDGIGALRVLRTLVEAYAADAAATDLAATDLAATDLAATDLAGTPLPGTDLADAGGAEGDGPAADEAGRTDAADHPADAAESVRKAAAAAWHRPPARLRPAGGPREAGYGVLQLALPAHELAGGGPGGANDVLVAALHLAVAWWNARGGRTGGQVRVRMPVTRRDADQRWDGVANLTEQFVVTSGPGERADPRVLLASVAAQTRRARQRAGAGEPATVIGRRRGLLPARLRLRLLRLGVPVARYWMMPTAALSNLGRVPGRWSFGAPGPPGETGAAGRAGDGEASGPSVTRLYFTTFAGPPQGLSVAATGYGGEVLISLGYCRSLFDARAAADFAALLRAGVREVGG